MIAFLRNTWRGLTSMRTALTLLFLLALAAMPGALLPQLSLNAHKVDDYVAEHGWWGELLAKLGFFEVYATSWFAAIYLLLFVSLVGCLLPRTWEYFKQMRAKPVLTPRNLSRMPHHARGRARRDAGRGSSAGPRRPCAAGGWTTRGEDTVSAERGYLRETGNLVFHFALLGLLVVVRAGQDVQLRGPGHRPGRRRPVLQRRHLQLRPFRPGLRVDGTDLTPFCVEIDEFSAEYLRQRPARRLPARTSRYQSGDDLAVEHLAAVHAARSTTRCAPTGDRRLPARPRLHADVHRDVPRTAQKRTQGIQWLPTDQLTLASEGATKFDPPGVTDSETRRKNQIAITGPARADAVAARQHPELEVPRR